MSQRRLQLSGFILSLHVGDTTDSLQTGLDIIANEAEGRTWERALGDAT